jgi:hypothetical protein
VNARRVLATTVASLLFTVVACSGTEEAAVPEGYQLVEHPLAVVAVPDTWTTRGTDLPDPDAVQLQVPEVDEELQVGGAVYRHDDAADSAEGVALVTLEALLQAAQEREQTERREVRIDGADDAFLLQAQAPSSLFDEPVRFTVIAARDGDGAPVVVRLLGTEEHVPDDVIETVLETMRVTG